MRQSYDQQHPEVRPKRPHLENWSLDWKSGGQLLHLFHAGYATGIMCNNALHTSLKVTRMLGAWDGNYNNLLLRAICLSELLVSIKSC